MGKASNEQREPQYTEQQGLRVSCAKQARQTIAVSKCQIQNNDHGDEGDRESNAALHNAGPNHQHGEHWKVEGHHEVLNDKNGQNRGGFAVSEAPEIAQNLRDYAGG